MDLMARQGPRGQTDPQGTVAPLAYLDLMGHLERADHRARRENVETLASQARKGHQG